MTEQRRNKINVVDTRWNQTQLGCSIKWDMKIKIFYWKNSELRKCTYGSILGGFELDGHTQVA